MGVVIPFQSKPRPAAVSARHAVPDDAERAVLDALTMGVDRVKLVRAAYPLFERCRDRFGIAVLSDGLPLEDETLAQCLVKLSQALRSIASVMGRREPTWVFGVTFGGTALTCTDDDGTMLLDIPVDTDLAGLSHFLAEQLKLQVA
jgi:hypothetical protein